MNKKHFQAIAAVLAEIPGIPGFGGDMDVGDLIDVVAERLADVFAGFNGQFDRDRFLRAAEHSDYQE